MEPIKNSASSPLAAAPQSAPATMAAYTEALNGSSLEYDALTTTGHIGANPQPAPTEPPQQRRRRRLLRYGLIGLVLIVGLGVLITMLRQPSKEEQLANSNVSQRYGNVSVPLGDIPSSSANLSPLGNVTIAGRLNVSNSIVLTPGIQPSNGVAGQLYFDKQTQQLKFYDGLVYDNLSTDKTSVASIGGGTGAITLGSGLSLNSNVLAFNGAAGVSSVQGQAGAVSFRAGQGIAINGTTISSSGVFGIGGATGTISLGAGLGIDGTTLRNNGVLNVSGGTNITVSDNGNGGFTINSTAGSGTLGGSGTTGSIALFNGTQSLGNSLLSQSSGTVSVAGNVNISGSLSLGTPLAVSQGGTGLTSFLANQLLYAATTSSVSQVASGTSGQCLLSNGGAAPSFQACP